MPTPTTQPLTIEEAYKMQGFEFTYFFDDGDSMPAYIKMFDPARGFTAWSFSLTTTNGLTFLPENEDEEKEQACCVMFRDIPQLSLYEVLAVLAEIKATGQFHSPGPRSPFASFGGCPF